MNHTIRHQQNKEPENGDSLGNEEGSDADIQGAANVVKNCELAKFWMATLRNIPRRGHDDDDENRPTPTIDLSKCPVEYVINLYATFAERFDELLVEKLDYQTPTKLRRLLDSVMTDFCYNGSFRFERAMDLGCGTGLSGVAFADLVGGSFIGIDLSPEMAIKARERQCYDHVMVGDVTQAFSTVVENNKTTKRDGMDVLCFDLVIACDVFCYLGDLSIVFAAVSRSLRSTCPQNGYFCFSTECLDVGMDGPVNLEFCLHECARFQHNERYLRRLAADHGMDVVRLEKDTIRKNQGMYVNGWLVILQKRSDTTPTS